MLALTLLSSTVSTTASAQDAPPTPAAVPCTTPSGQPAIAGWQALGPDLWWLPGAPGDSNDVNRGAISNLLLLIDGTRTWLVGAGPSAAYGRALAANIRCRFGRDVSDAIAPWPRPELVLGLAGLPAGVRLWAHADVAAAMAERCGHCVERLASRLGKQAGDLGDPVSIPRPGSLLSGDQGRLGPWHWWLIERTPGTVTTLWWHAPSGVATAHGLSWSDGAPDLRDATLDGLFAGVARLEQIGADLPGPSPRWLPEQGDIGALAAPAAQAAYWQSLRRAVDAALAAGVGETDPAPSSLPGVPSGLTRGERHALNWQRAWREREEQAFESAPAER
ncbi:hypothetical protein [Sphaerotilus mobilis]|uniref:Uncharacterized protein n=1 Tax=Sphaerotilus mobilis TaxID=47994 RepID=A0A4Q7LT05_9BURK|nr:hypothetical protein [Sphaerotilus mobilis]RZS56849.1 hypothetical protein EV685_1404 [Sphaerotilus mobilis]